MMRFIVLVCLLVPCNAWAQCGPGGCSTGGCPPQLQQYQFQSDYQGPFIQRSVQQSATFNQPRVSQQPISRPATQGATQGSSARPIPWDTQKPVIKLESRGEWFDIGNGMRERSTKHGSGFVFAKVSENGRSFAYGLSCSHIFGINRQIIVRYYPNGQASVELLANDGAMDIALVRFEIPPVNEVYMIPLAERNPPVGTKLTAVGWEDDGLVGFGGDLSRLTDGMLYMVGQAQEGMSGGLIHNRDAAVSVLTESEMQGPGIPTTTTGGPSMDIIKEWLRSERYGWLFEDNSTENTPQEPDYQPPAQSEVHTLNLVAVKENTRKIEANKKDISDLQTQLSSIDERLVIVENVSTPLPLPGEKGEKGDKGDPGEKGEKGDPGKDAITPTPVAPVVEGISHMVLVSSQFVEYWGELEGLLKKARGHYSIQLEIPGRNVGPLPALVAYKGGVPQWSVTGLAGVKKALVDIADDTFTPILKGE